MLLSQETTPICYITDPVNPGKYHVQLWTVNSGLNDYLSATGAVKIDQCSCGTERETIRRFPFIAFSGGIIGKS